MSPAKSSPIDQGQSTAPGFCSRGWSVLCGRQPCMPSCERKLEPFKGRKAKTNYYQTLIFLMCPCCAVAEWTVAVCSLGRILLMEKKVLTTSRCSFHQDVSPFWHKPIAWNKTLGSYCLRVIPSHFLEILVSGKSKFFNVLVCSIVKKSFKCIFKIPILEIPSTLFLFFFF